MVELTHGGTWLKWDSLSRRDRNWAILSFATSAAAAIPVALASGDWGYRLGFRMGSGGMESPPSPFLPLMTSDLFSYAILASLLLAIVSAFAWWQFSRNQDEMFNMIQNYALGQSGAWTLTVALGWWLLSLGGWVGPLPLAALVAFGVALLIGFWLVAVRRWA